MRNKLPLKQRLIEQSFFRPRWYSIFLNPYFIDRYNLYKNIRNFSAKYTSKNDRILDVGCGNEPYRNIFPSKEYVGIDIAGGGHSDQEKKVEKFFDGLNIPFTDNSFEVVICTQVLEHSTDHNQLTKEISRTLKPGGKLFLTVPFVCNEHETPYDFRRLTRFELQRLCRENDLKILELHATTGIFGVIGQLLSGFLFESLHFRNSPIKLLLSVFVLGPLQGFFIILDIMTGRRFITLDYVTIAEKNAKK